MNDSPFWEARHKLSRSIEHAQTLDEEITNFLSGYPYRIDTEFDTHQSKYLLRLNVVKPLPQTRWALIIGDCLHNARAALDYIAWRLAGSDLKDRDTLFPIFLTPDGFNKKRALERLKRIPDGAIAELRKLQPYMRPYATPSALWNLHDLDARDKHKLLTMTQTIPKSAEINIVHSSDSAPVPVRFHQGPFDDNAIIAEIDCPIGIENPKVEVGSKYTFDIAFQQGIVTESGDVVVRTAIPKILEAVNKIIVRFEQLTGENPKWIK